MQGPQGRIKYSTTRPGLAPEELAYDVMLVKHPHRQARTRSLARSLQHSRATIRPTRSIGRGSAGSGRGSAAHFTTHHHLTGSQVGVRSTKFRPDGSKFSCRLGGFSALWKPCCWITPTGL